MTATTNAAGGDYTGLPTKPVQHRGRRQHTGLDWDALTENYTARGGQVDASVWHKGKVQIVEGGRRGVDRVHTYALDSEYDETTAPRATRPKRTSAQPGAKLTDEQRAEIGRRYQAGETLTPLAKAYGVAVTTIRNTLKGQGVETRPAGRPS